MLPPSAGPEHRIKRVYFIFLRLHGAVEHREGKASPCMTQSCRPKATADAKRPRPPPTVQRSTAPRSGINPRLPLPQQAPVALSANAIS